MQDYIVAALSIAIFFLIIASIYFNNSPLAAIAGILCLSLGYFLWTSGIEYQTGLNSTFTPDNMTIVNTPIYSTFDETWSNWASTAAFIVGLWMFMYASLGDGDE